MCIRDRNRIQCKHKVYSRQHKHYHKKNGIASFARFISHNIFSLMIAGDQWKEFFYDLVYFGIMWIKFLIIISPEHSIAGIHKKSSEDQQDPLKFIDESYPCSNKSVSYTHLRAHETPEHLVCRLLLEKK